MEKPRSISRQGTSQKDRKDLQNEFDDRGEMAVTMDRAKGARGGKERTAEDNQAKDGVDKKTSPISPAGQMKRTGGAASGSDPKPPPKI